MQVNILEAKNRLSELIRCVQAGEDVVIANRGKPVARLVAEGGRSLAGPTGSSGSSGQTIIDWLAAHPLPAYAQRSAAEIDASIEEERNAWD